MDKLRIGVSACLLGRKVRYDGGHRRNELIIQALGNQFEWVPVCPEFELGLGAPRETMRLEGDAAAPRLVTTETRRDLTDAMTNWCDARIEELEKERLRGFIFKSRSPSCGTSGVPLFSAEEGTSTGLFAAAFMKRFPGIPVEEEGRLADPVALQSFIARVLG